MRTILFVVFCLLLSTSAIAKPIKVIPAVKKKVIKQVPKLTTDSDLNCLARNIYFESRGENFIGQLAVGLVTLERKDSNNFPSTICGVVKADHAFSWTSTPRVVKNKDAFDTAKMAATLAILIRGLGLDLLQADHFHVVDLKKYPRWAYHYDPVVIIGKHIFYRSDS